MKLKIEFNNIKESCIYEFYWNIEFILVNLLMLNNKWRG